MLAEEKIDSIGSFQEGNTKKKKKRKRPKNHNLLPQSSIISNLTDDSNNVSTNTVEDNDHCRSDDHSFIKKIIFDETGGVKEIQSQEKLVQISTFNRKAKKRSGYFSMNNIYSPLSHSNCDKFKELQPVHESESKSETTAAILSNKMSPDIVMKISKDQHLNIQLYQFPNDYNSVVKYWYLTFEQLNYYGGLPENLPMVKCLSEQETEQYVDPNKITDSLSSANNDDEPIRSISNLTDSNEISFTINPEVEQG